MSHIEKTEAIVLKSRKYRETSKIVTFYTKRFGKINGIVKGARKLKSKYGASLETLSYVALVLYKKQTTSLHLISQCDLLNSFQTLSRNLEKLSVGLKIIELVYKVLHEEEENASIFNLLLESLKTLDQSEENYYNVFFTFEIKLGELLGYRFNFNNCSKCESDIFTVGVQNKELVFDFSKGGPLCTNCKNQALYPVKITFHNCKILNDFEKTKNIKSVMDIKISDKNISEIGKFLFDYLRYHIGILKDLKSDKVFKQIL